jgi:cytochrome b
MAHTVRIWDLPTRGFHWLLALCVVALVITAKVGGNAMVWHLRLGHVVLALLVFRLLWGLVGGYWSRLGRLFFSPARMLSYLRGQGQARDEAGHNPLGALSVLALLAVLIAQVASGLFSDDEIAFAGPLTRFVSGDTVAWATGWHKDWGQTLLLVLLGLHLAAIAFYSLVRRKRLVAAMVSGDKQLPHSVPASRDGAAQRMLAAVLLALCAALAWWIYGLGGF